MSSYWLDDIILPRKRKISLDDGVKRSEFSNFSSDSVILSEVRLSGHHTSSFVSL